MKKTIVLAAVTLLSTMIWAQKPRMGMHKGMQKPGMEQRGPNRDQMFKDLALTEAQQTEMKALQTKFRQQMQALQKNENITVKEQRDQRAALAKAQRQQIEKILTPEQKNTLQEKRKQQQQKMQANANQRWETMAAELQLTEAQKATLAAARTSHRNTMQQIMKNENMPRTEKREALQKAKEAQKAIMENTLTADQLKELKAKRTTHGKQGTRQHRYGAGGGNRGNTL